MIRTSILWLHKWIGILSGIIIFIVSITGCIYAFEQELKLLMYPQKYYIKKYDNKDIKPLRELMRSAQAALPDARKITRVDLYPQEGRSWVFRAVETDEQAFGHWNYFKYYDRVFVDPYSAQVIAVENSKTEFLQLALQLHLNLLLGKKFGHPLVGYSTAIFVVLLISGFVLWWPKKWKGKRLKRSFWIKSSVKWKRLNYDLHNVLGFYALLFALILCITGLVFAFPGFKKSYTSFFDQLGNSTPKTELRNRPIPSHFNDPLDNALAYALQQHPEADMMSIRIREKGNPIDIQIRLKKDQTSKFKWYYFDAKSGDIIRVESDDKLSTGGKVSSMNYDIHVGTIGGLPTKILAFFISLICASLPVTGYLLWWNKEKKEKRKRLN